MVRFVLFYFLIYRPLLRRKISLGRDGVTRTHFGGISKGSELCSDAEILVRFVLFYFLIYRPLLKRKIMPGT